MEVIDMLPTLWKNRESFASPLWDDLMENFFYGWPSADSEVQTAWCPRTDVRETEKEIVLDLEIPGIDKKDIKVEVKDNTLTISGERNEEKAEEGTDYYRRERRYGKFERSFGLPDTVEEDKVSAQYKNGILTLTLQKSEKALPKEINVEVK
jgi:HSP20 family protein